MNTGIGIKIAIAIGVFIVLVIGVFLIFISSGTYSVAATRSHTGFTRWVLNTVMENSVRHHARGIKAPSLSDESLVQKGFRHYQEMCRSCHGAPGVPRSEMSKGLNPPAPDLAEAAQEWTPSELYWITRYGIKMSGMPAWGPTHDEDELWAMVAFVKRLPDLSPEEYHSMAQATTGEMHEHHHDTAEEGAESHHDAESTEEAHEH